MTTLVRWTWLGAGVLLLLSEAGCSASADETPPGNDAIRWQDTGGSMASDTSWPLADTSTPPRRDSFATEDSQASDDGGVVSYDIGITPADSVVPNGDSGTSVSSDAPLPTATDATDATDAFSPADTGSSDGADQDGDAPYDTLDALDGQPPKDSRDTAPNACEGLDRRQSQVLYLSTDDSNSMASPVLARALLRLGRTVAPQTVRTYEFLNYYNVDYGNVVAGAVQVAPQARPGTRPGDVELQIGVQAAAQERRPLSLTLVLDTSASMAGSSLALEVATVRAIAGQLRAGDVVSAVTWNTTQTPVLTGHTVTGANDPDVLAVATKLTAGGNTDLNTALAKGYQLALSNYDSQRLNRVVLISDGGANVGPANVTLIGQQANDRNREGIYLVGVGVGDPKAVDDSILNELTDMGNGAYVYLDSEEEAARMFGARFGEVIDVAARDVSVRVTLPWYFQMRAYHGEAYATDPAKVKPQHLAPKDAMVFHQILHACSSDAISLLDPIEVRVDWDDPATYQPRYAEVTTSLSTLYETADKQLRRGRAIVAYAEALKLPSSASVRDALTKVREARSVDGSPELEEIETLLRSFATQRGISL